MSKRYKVFIYLFIHLFVYVTLCSKLGTCASQASALLLMYTLTCVLNIMCF